MTNASELASTVQDSSSIMSVLPIPQPTSPFEELPIEIHIMILHQMASPMDLSATFRASPTALGAFLSSREAILASVLERHIPPEIFSHYVAILTAPSYADFSFVAPFDPDLGYEEDEPYDDADHEEPRWEEWWKFALDIYKDKIDIANCARSGGLSGEELRWFTLKTSQVPTEKQTEIFKKNVQSLAVLYGTIERFTKDIQAFSYNIAQDRQQCPQILGFSNPPDDPEQWPPLSPGERIRLQRGLLRYEMCCRLFGRHYLLRMTTAVTDRGYDEDDPYWNVLDLMSSWELQELVAIRAYVQRKYEILHFNVQSEFLVDIRSLDRESRRTAPKAVDDASYKQLPVPTSEKPQYPVLISWGHLNTVMGTSIDWVDGMSRFGLVTLQNILRSDAGSRAKLHGDVVNWMDSLPFRCWLNPHEFISYSGWVYHERRQHGQDTMQLRGANTVFLAAQKERATLRCIAVDDKESFERGAIHLQQLGWVFWEDRTRLSTLQLPRHDPDERRPKAQLSPHFVNNVRRPLHYEVEGLLHQVKGALITSEDWNNIIVPKYGFIEDWVPRNFSSIENILGC